MKYITRITLVTLLLALTGVVFSQGTTLVIFSENGEKFTLEINGSTQNYEPSARVETDDLYGPTTKVELYPADPQESMLKKSIFNKPNAVVYYVYKQDKKGRYFLEKTTHDRSGEVSGETPSTGAGKFRERPPLNLLHHRGKRRKRNPAVQETVMIQSHTESFRPPWKPSHDSHLMGPNRRPPKTWSRKSASPPNRLPIFSMNSAMKAPD